MEQRFLYRMTKFIMNDIVSTSKTTKDGCRRAPSSFIREDNHA
jgi:hypothetical protein